MSNIRRVVAVLALCGLVFAPAFAGAGLTPAQQCAIAKLKAAAKKSKTKLDCWQKAVAKVTAVDTGCLQKAEAKFDLAFAKAEQSGGCATTSDAPAVEAAVDGLVDQLATRLALPPRINLYGVLAGKSGPMNVRAWNLGLFNAGSVAASDATVTAITLTQVSGAACTPVLLIPPPRDFGTLPAQVGVSSDFYFDFSTCPGAATFDVTIGFSSNLGAIEGMTTLPGEMI